MSRIWFPSPATVLIVVTLCGTGLALINGFFISLNGYFEFPCVVELALYGFIVAIGVSYLALVWLISGSIIITLI